MSLVPVLLSLPWLLYPTHVVLRGARSRSLDDEPEMVPAADVAPLVSVIVPARDERRNIERCVRSLLAARWPRLEVIVVDDHSTDGTAALARAVAPADPRLRVVENPPLPEGWLGKPWACATGAREARGAILCFTDADTRHAPDLLPRAVHALERTGSGLVSVAGRQEMGSFWERLVQPQVFTMILARFGGTEIVNRSPHAWDKIANGQFLLFRREAYDAVGGHAAVRHAVAEDLMLAQRTFAAGQKTRLFMATAQLATRMYTSRRELVAGWAKNVYAGSGDALPPGRLARALHPLLLLLFPVLELAPVVGLALALLIPGADALLAWGALASLFLLAYWVVAYVGMEESPLPAPLFPLGAAMLLWIVVVALRRGARVEWKGREYVVRT